jgi:ATP-dependent Lon protease
MRDLRPAGGVTRVDRLKRHARAGAAPPGTTRAIADSDAPSLPADLPVLPLRRTVAFPLTLQPLAVSRPVSVESVHTALGADRLVLLLLQRSEGDEPGPADLHRVGTVGVVRQMVKAPGGLNVIVEGVARVHADEITRTDTTMRARITPRPEPAERSLEVEAHVRRVQELGGAPCRSPPASPKTCATW